MIETYLKEVEISGIKTFKTYAKIESVKPDPNNPRDISEYKMKDLKDFISKYGELKPVLVDIRPEKEGQLIGGNMRLKAYQELGKTELWVEPTDPMTDAQSFEIGTIDNMEFGRYVDTKLAALMQQYKDEIDLAKLSVPTVEFPDLATLLKQWDEKHTDIKEDEPPAVDETQTVSKLGEVYQLGRHRLLCGDATKIEDVEKLMDGQKADMIFTDPPYGVSYEGKTKEKLTIKNDENTDTFALVLPNMIAVSKGGAAYYVCCPAGNKFKDFFIPFEKYCHLSATIIWAKQQFVLGHGDYHYQHEPILYGWSNESTHTFYGDRSQTTLWHIDRPTVSLEHPTMKPIALVAKAIGNSSKQDDIILDTFGGSGSGSTLIASEQTNRTCYMMELDPKYCDVIRKRYAKFIDKETEWEATTPVISDVQPNQEISQDNTVSA